MFCVRARLILNVYLVEDSKTSRLKVHCFFFSFFESQCSYECSSKIGTTDVMSIKPPKRYTYPFISLPWVLPKSENWSTVPYNGEGFRCGRRCLWAHWHIMGPELSEKSGGWWGRYVFFVCGCMFIWSGIRIKEFLLTITRFLCLEMGCNIHTLVYFLHIFLIFNRRIRWIKED